MSTNFDALIGVGFLFLLIPFILWFLISRKQYGNLKESTIRVQVLSTRTALFLPFYSLFMWLSLTVPDLATFLEIPTSIAEAFSFYSFYMMIIENLGGADNALLEVRNAYKNCCCCPIDATDFYYRTLRALRYFLIIRVPIVALSVIFEYTETTAGFAVMTVLSVIILGWAFLSLVYFYHILMPSCKNLNATFKLVLVKISIGIAVIQGIIMEILLASGNLGGDSSEHEDSMRIYYFVVLVEYAFLAIALYSAFGKDIEPSPSAVSRSTERSIDPHSKPNQLFHHFLFDIFAFFDFFSELYPQKYGPDSSTSMNAESSIQSPLVV